MEGSEPSCWDELMRTADVVRADVPEDDDVVTRHHRVLPSLAGLAAVGAAVAALLMMSAHPLVAAANPTGDSVLFSLTNQDRASNGVPSLRANGKLNGIGEATGYSICGQTVAGRSQDMINRAYFSHYIPPCGKLVFVIMQEAGVAYQSAGENIGWTGGITDPSAAATYINSQFMNSPDHRSNILNRNYTDLGIGSAFAASWNGSGAISNAWMFSEEFTQSSAPPPPPVQPRPTSAGPVPPRNSSAPPTLALPPTTTQAPTPAPTAVPTPVPTPTPNPFNTLPAITGGIAPPLITEQGGLLSGSVESVLESYLVN